MFLHVGDKAPDFTLLDQNANSVSLHDFKNKNVLLLFFPFANSSVCTLEMCLIRDNLELLKKLNTEVIGISVDSPYSLKLWAEKNNFQFLLLSDFNKKVSAMYDSLYELLSSKKYGYEGVCKRSVFIIDTDRIIKHIEFCETPGHHPNYEEIMRILKK